MTAYNMGYRLEVFPSTKKNKLMYATVTILLGLASETVHITSTLVCT